MSRQLDGTAVFDNCGEDSCYFSRTGKARYWTHSNIEHYNNRIPTLDLTRVLMYSAGPKGYDNWWEPAYTVPEAYSLDVKLDDGIANEGNFIAYHNIGGGLTVDGCSDNYLSTGGADYVAANLSDKSTKRCSIAYVIK
ncbi:MAG: hypothetical protein PQ612_10190 [Rickettsiales bacterium]|nr:hypothetical protein [Pseudomonadota bacterium]MDA0967578.1 hypothetical protein [Pseudomonadota bacterium]MDG4544393.1 hypothetical protein [Rickettsiales bacterium]MDG4546523.1 hypothetical protein [Rickettsiales bacterium]MDG4548641.1 hypothetical protein [Rickettsiales bacterium]